MEKRPVIDPLIYDKNTWPKMTMEEKRDSLVTFAGKLTRYYQEEIEKQIGKAEAKEIGSEVWRNLFQEGIESEAEALGCKGLKNPIPVMKWSAHIEEERMGATGTTVEANEATGTRAIVLCPLAEVLRKEDCACMAEGARRYIEENYPGYGFSLDSIYQENHICIYRMFKK
jgi:hypothetical protein